MKVDLVQQMTNFFIFATVRKKMTSNSNIEFYSPPKIVTVDRNNVLFVIHRRGFITCVCGNVVNNMFVISKLILSI